MTWSKCDLRRRGLLQLINTNKEDELFDVVLDKAFLDAYLAREQDDHDNTDSSSAAAVTTNRTCKSGV